MRADRLVAVLLLMQARGRVTAAELAGELEVSVATARRDLEALSSAGVPVYPQPGRGGGWRLVGRARTDLSGLTASEARALFLLVGPAASGSPEVRAALRKLVRALPETFREGALAAADAVVVDVAGWGEVGRGRPGLVGVLEEAVVGRRRVVLVYEGRGGVRSERVVEPWGLVDKDEVWYLVAGTGAGERTFRVDRVVSARVTEEVFERPVGFDLSVAWERVVSEVERRRGSVSAVVSVEPRFAHVLRDQFGRHCEVLAEVGGRARLRLSAPAPLMIAQVLAGWGGLVEVVESGAVRAELARLGAELVALHGSG
ncbi:putative DNA-binding transcriptional regulator YafY [Saccharothrix carnea]|uniref:Putative DNA-binding transcriptional regulator YafY n=1 Tax=Saccharothrix carnea TaxID=1280637 RepID=A0A2P8IGP5_SACCR|nr:WYL domain-containing protein [Saccharothrix carnea]PSL57636.1 putative DNA-binding transcriptional regulator YafY [Saccharothrix carnea]